ncbi:MAG: CHAD domain-containing protein [Burkholderiaceae bacterium]|nr:CHAD domain-containing protein [Burkholderiaceae bacterium]
MSEQEVKLNVPPAARAGVARDMQRGDARGIHLHAMYFDTPTRELAKARIALRLRLEGDVWVQTLKTPGADAITRVEMNHDRPGPILDLSVYAGTAVEAALTNVQGELGLRYETDVQRVVRKVRGRQGSVELAYDIGEIRAGGFVLPISELEFELVSGRVGAIFETARTWLQRHGLVMDARSKSERGDALAALAADLDHTPGVPADADAKLHAKRSARIAEFWGVRGMEGVKLESAMTTGQALAAISAECLDQVTRNAAMLADVDTAGALLDETNPTYVHQLRVGVRRLRSAWKLFTGLAVLPPTALQDDVKQHFGSFGANRDRDVQDATVLPLLRDAGMPELPPAPAVGEDDSATLARSKSFQALLLALLEWTVTPQPALKVELPAAQALPLATDAANAAAEAAAVAAGSSATPPASAQDVSSTGDVPAAQAAGSFGTVGTAQGASTHVVPTIIPLTPVADIPSLDSILLTRLRLWHKQITKRGRIFTSLDIEKKHALRKKVKQLRYGLAFSESLLPAARLRAYRKHLSVVQDLLGEFNDLAVAHETYKARTADHGEAWFAVGWLHARQNVLVAQAQDAFQDLAKAPGFWK